MAPTPAGPWTEKLATNTLKATRNPALLWRREWALRWSILGSNRNNKIALNMAIQSILGFVESSQ